jgi:hypothetical protein
MFAGADGGARACSGHALHARDRLEHPCRYLLRPPQALERLTESSHGQPLFERESAGARVPAFVKREFEDYSKCGILSHGFARLRCRACGDESLIALS